VPEKRAEKQRYWLTFLLKDLEEGAVFKPQALHLTIIPWFVKELVPAAVIKSFYSAFTGQESFDIEVGREDTFKNSRKISVNLLRYSSELTALHGKALEWFDAIGARWAVNNPYVAEEFVPHVRRRQGHNVSEGDTLRISSLGLVTASRRGDDKRTLAAKVAFK
jgi:2'-5' RNA ligase